MRIARPANSNPISSVARLGRVLRPRTASDHSQGTRGAAATAAHRTFWRTIGGSAFSAMNGYHGATETITIAHGKARSPSMASPRIATRQTHSSTASLGLRATITPPARPSRAAPPTKTYRRLRAIIAGEILAPAQAGTEEAPAGARGGLLRLGDLSAEGREPALEGVIGGLRLPGAELQQTEPSLVVGRVFFQLTQAEGEQRPDPRTRRDLGDQVGVALGLGRFAHLPRRPTLLGDPEGDVDAVSLELRADRVDPLEGPFAAGVLPSSGLRQGQGRVIAIGVDSHAVDQAAQGGDGGKHVVDPMCLPRGCPAGLFGVLIVSCQQQLDRGRDFSGSQSGGLHVAGIGLRFRRMAGPRLGEVGLVPELEPLHVRFGAGAVASHGTEANMQ